MPEGEGFKVFVVDQGGTEAHARPVEVGVRADSLVQIVKVRLRGQRSGSSPTAAYGVEEQLQGRPRQTTVTPREKGLFAVVASNRRFVYLVVTLASIAGVWAACQAAVGDLSRASVSRSHHRRERHLARRAPGDVQRHAAYRRSGERRAGCDPRANAIHSWRSGDQRDLLAGHGHDFRAPARVQGRVNAIRNDLPTDLDVQIERLTPSLFPIISYNLTGGDSPTLYDIAR